MFKTTNPQAHVILIHGLGRRASSLRRVAARLQAQGYAVTSWGYASRTYTLDRLARQLAVIVGEIVQVGQPIHCVTHSMGALVLRRCLAQTSLPQLGRIVMLAPPNNGSQLARHLLHCPFARHALGPAGCALADSTAIAATCAIPHTPVMVIAGTRATDLRNPAALLGAHVLEPPHDGTVMVRETLLPHMDRFIEVDACHTWIMNHPQTLDAISTFLAE